MYYINNVDSKEIQMRVSELKALWATWLETHDKPVKGSEERYAELTVRDIEYHFEYDDPDLTLDTVSSAPGLGVKRIKHLEDVLGITFARKDIPAKPPKTDPLALKMEKIKDLLSDDRFESKDWKHADAAGRIEWLIAMLESKNEEIDMWVDMINGEAN
jgi:hypothetical protein